MIYVRLMGGVGNQLFQYATGWALSRHFSTELKIDTRYFQYFQLHGGYKLDRFSIYAQHADPKDLDKLFPEWKLKLAAKFPHASKCFPWLVTEEKQVELSDFNSHQQNLFLFGYWQNDAFFKHYREEILSQYCLKLTSSKKFSEYSSLIKTSACAVAVHIRRGDYLSNPKALKFHGICSANYYNTALKQISETLGRPLSIFIFTDDPEWVREYLLLPAEILLSQVLVVGTSAEEDLMLMSDCQHHVIANSTFSWWGAWLARNANQVVIAPKPWFNNINYEKRCRILPVNWLTVGKN